MEIRDVINHVQAHYQKENIEVSKALHQHRDFANVLEREGIQVRLLSAKKEFPEQVFTRDIGFTIENTLYVGKLKQQIRQGEELILRKYLDDNHFNYVVIDEGTIEGGDVLIDGAKVFVGDGSRTERSAVSFLVNQHPHLSFYNIRFKKEYLHLDCVFNPVSSDMALIYREAIAPEDIHLLEKEYELLEVNEKEQFTLATNVLSIGEKRVIALPQNKVTNDKLRDKGFHVIEVESPKLLSQAVHSAVLRCRFIAKQHRTLFLREQRPIQLSVI